LFFSFPALCPRPRSCYTPRPRRQLHIERVRWEGLVGSKRTCVAAVSLPSRHSTWSRSFPPSSLAAYAAPIIPNSFSVSTSLGRGKSCVQTVHAPDTPLHLGVKFNPVRGVHPFLRHTTSGTNPGLGPPIFTAEKTNIGSWR